MSSQTVPETGFVPSPIGLVRGLETPEAGKVLNLWVAFRGEDRFPAIPLVEITEVKEDEMRPGVLEFVGVELAQPRHYMAWEENTVIEGRVHPERGVIGFTSVDGAGIEPDVEEFFFLPPFGQVQ